MSINDDLSNLMQQATSGALTPGLAISVEVSVRRRTSGAYDPTTSSVATTETAWTAKALPGEVSAARAASSDGLHVAGDRVFSFAAADLPDGVAVNDRIVIGAVTLVVYHVQKKVVGPTVLSIAAYAREESGA